MRTPALTARLTVWLTVWLTVAALLLVTGPVAGAEPSPSEPASGVWPLLPAPEVAHGFDPPTEPWGAGHRGVDLRGWVGQPVRAALGGTVTWAGPLAGRGVVVVDHGGTRTTYEPVAAGVRVGDVVAPGDRLGLLDLAGSHCFPGACLHWGWLRGEVYLDPLRLVGAGPVRLLPLGVPPATQERRSSAGRSSEWWAVPSTPGVARSSRGPLGLQALGCACW